MKTGAPQKPLKGIILAGGSGTRLHPATRAVSKQLIPIYNKPMVYHPLSSLMFAGVRDVLIITTPDDQSGFQRLLGDGHSLGMNFQYAAQPSPDGLAQSFLIGKSFIGNDNVALALGDNIFYGHGVPDEFRRAAQNLDHATVFAYEVKDPERYGVVAFGKDGRPVDIIEKPAVAPSKFAVVGLYFYDNNVVSIAESLKPSPRGELEITDVNRRYLEAGTLEVVKLGRGTAWFDTGTYDSLLQASVFVQSIEERQGLMVACIEEIAFRNGYIDATQLAKLAEPMKKNAYGQYLFRLLEG
ncbi:MAG: glucose-1-phosphate thymidylyltransferase RfbA [Deltaproteobacteria bacterium]|nr:glucose-1-phosphate thymidylyltransferase RfbA [Deltaproteobacteria bacterium]